MEREEYNRDINPYPSFGKKYNNEKAIISMTSWKMRIATCSKTLYSLLTQCPGFHIVLVLSEEEFPKMTAELPENLMLFVDNELIELMFVRKNYKSFKKVLFSMDKYRDVPVISADDDCIYTCNYAQELYDKWEKNKNCCVTYKNITNFKGTPGNWGAASLYPPYYFKEFGLKFLTKEIVKTSLDDGYYCVLRFHLKLNEVQINKDPFRSVFNFHTKQAALCSNYLRNNLGQKVMNQMDKIIYAGIKNS